MEGRQDMGILMELMFITKLKMKMVLEKKDVVKSTNLFQ